MKASKDVGQNAMQDACLVAKTKAAVRRPECNSVERGRARAAVFFALLGAAAAIAHCKDVGRTSHFSKEPWFGEHGQVLLLSFMSMCSNWFVLGYHFGTPPHSKFLRSTCRKLVIGAHVVAGVSEIFALTFAFFAADPTHAARFGALVALAGHVPTSFFMTPEVFGAKHITVPGYYSISAMHAWCALNLLLSPTSLLWLLRVFNTLHIYAYVRVCLGMFNKLRLFKGNEYTAAAVLASVVCMPAVIGPIGVLLFLVYLFVCGHVFLPAHELRMRKLPSRRRRGSRDKVEPEHDGDAGMENPWEAAP